MPVNTIAPILSPLRDYSGTFYSMSGSINDSALLFSSDNIRVKFSKFACIKLPKWANQSEQRLFRSSTDIGEPFITDPNTVFVKAYLQNYVENLQQYAEGYRTDNTFQNSAELAFWKSLRYVSDQNQLANPVTSAIQFQQDVTYVKPDNSVGQKYTELPNDTGIVTPYDQVVQFIGNINMLNHVRTGGQEYMEIYCHIPRDVGRAISPKFKPHDNMTFSSVLLPSTAGPEYIAGRSSEYTANTNNVKAIYDNVSTRQYDVSSDLENLGIDFNEFDNRTSITDKYSNESFDFNAILLYYDIWDSTNEATLCRNLYGILLLDRFTSTGTATIPSLRKYAPDAVQPGNAYGFRQNLKWSNYSNQITSEITIGNELVGLDLYMNAIQRLVILTDEYSKMSSIVAKQQTQINRLNQLVLQLSS
jgi:hypothetical protein